MKKVVFCFALCLLFSFKVADTELTMDERTMALNQLNQSQDHMLNTVKGLSQAQLNYKSSPTSWSVADCAEHLALTEASLWGMVDGALKQPADPSKRGDVKMSDEAVIKMITDRSSKFKTQEMFEPKNKFGGIDGIVKEFKDKRASHIEYVKTTKDDLRNRYAPMPFGTLDAYQIVLFMAGHTERHTKQMEEVIADANFPKK